MTDPLPGVVAAPAAGPSTLDLMTMYATMAARQKTLTQELEQLAALMKTIELSLAAKLDPEDTEASYQATLPSGVTVRVAKHSRERWVPIDGQSNDFWNWVFTTGRAQEFCTRELKQEGVDVYRAAHRTPIMPEGELPPFIKRMTIVSPKVEVKGLTKPRSTSATL
jgi:hypothetical protein